MSDWLPIESAPKDGTPMLLWLKKAPDRNYSVKGVCDNHAIGFWLHSRWSSIEVEDCGTMGGEMTGWMSDWASLDLSPTHWMPLPPAPR